MDEKPDYLIEAELEERKKWKAYRNILRERVKGVECNLTFNDKERAYSEWMNAYINLCLANQRYVSEQIAKSSLFNSFIS